MSDLAFNLLHDGIKRQIYRMKWEELRPMQAEAIRYILQTDHHLLISAATASGKTEAAFLPILSAIADEAEASLRAIYVGPLKALINDQFARMEELCQHLDVPVHRWHGDVSAAAKKKLVDRPGGVLLITPESLESLFVNRSRFLTRLLGGLRFVVIDELHSFLENERGRHLRSLLYRVGQRTEKPLRLIGLSATIGEPRVAIDYLDRDHPERVQTITGDIGEAELMLRLQAYLGPPGARSTTKKETEPDTDSHDDDEEPPHRAKLAADLVSHCRGKTNLVFANSRSDVEYFGDHCQKIAEGQGLADRFLVHHGSLSADLRQETEETMKQSSQTQRPATTFCSSTLEMGIDIGNVAAVGQIGAPYSVASLTQRVGRSGRRKGTARILRAYLECREVTEKSDLFDRLHLRLVQTIAIIELLLRRWVEPAQPCKFDLSTLTQQIISLVAETGGVSAQDAYQSLCQRGIFRDIPPADFARLLRQLGTQDVIQQMPGGDLILGLAGEDIRKDKGFYAAFMTGDAFAVMHDAQRIGSVDSPPEVKQHMILGGRRWQVVDVDQRQHVVYVLPAHGWKSAIFSGDGGSLHAKVVAEMRSVLRSRASYTYLNATAAQLLDDARATAAMTSFCTSPLIALEKGKTAFIPWVATRTLDTLQALFTAAGVEASLEEPLALKLARPLDACPALLRQLQQQPPPEWKIVSHLKGPPPRKYDYLLNDTLREESLRQTWLDLPTALASLAAPDPAG